MIEAPEACCLADELNRTIRGKKIIYVITGHTPHKFAWYSGTPEEYENRLTGRVIGKACAYGGMVEIEAGPVRIVFSDGIHLTYIEPGGKLPDKHQLLIGFDDESGLVASVRMYGGLWCFMKGDTAIPLNDYYQAARKKPQVMSDAFDRTYFLNLIGSNEMQKKSVKAALATEQTIPGLGNGVLQDILYQARIHPKTRISMLDEDQKQRLFDSIRSTLYEMYAAGGRYTEIRLTGRKGGYFPRLSKDTCGKPCVRCGEIIQKENYMGGSIYYCPGCQKK